MNDPLDTIGIRHQTDKASQFSRTYAKPHDYLRHLEQFFAPIRFGFLKILEVGCGGGESIQTWLDYFPKSEVYGVDLVHSTNPWNTPGAKPDKRYFFTQGDQGDLKFWERFIFDNGTDFDIIIDDGSHVSSDILTTFNCLWAHLKRGGIYEIEDLKQAPGASLWLFGQTEKVTAGISGIDSIYFARELAIIRKR